MATNKTAEQFYEEMMRQESEVENALSSLSLGLTTGLNETQLDESAFNKLIPFLVTAFIGSFARILLTGNQNIARISSSADVVITQNFLRQTVGTSAAIKFGQDVENYPAQVRNRLLTRTHPFDPRTLTDKLAYVKSGTTRTVQNIVAMGIKNGTPIKDIAKNIDMYINPKTVKGYVGPYDWKRKRFGYSRVASMKDIPKGSVSYNAHLIARSEASFTFRQSQLDMYGDKEWILGFEWILSPRHPIYDICDEWARLSPYKPENMPIDHHNGLCIQNRLMMTPDEWNQYLETGEKPQIEYGDPKEAQERFNLHKDTQKAIREGRLPKDFKPSKNLTLAELKLEKENMEYAFKNYDKLKNRYINQKDKDGNFANAIFGKDGEMERISLNTDEWRDYMKGYVGTNAHTNHQAVSWLNNRLTDEMLIKMKGKGNNMVGVLAGGGGSGKGTAAKEILAKHKFPIILDKTFANSIKGMAEIEKIRSMGYRVGGIFIHCPPTKAATNIWQRAVQLWGEGKMPRTVPLGQVAIPDNISARNFFIEILQKNSMNRTWVVDNSGAFQQHKEIFNKLEFLNSLPEYQLNQMRKEVYAQVESLFRQGKIPPNIYDGITAGGF